MDTQSVEVNCCENTDFQKNFTLNNTDFLSSFNISLKTSSIDSTKKYRFFEGFHRFTCSSCSDDEQSIQVKN